MVKKPLKSPSPPPSPTASEDSKVGELIADLKRTRADFENFRKQSDLQKENAISSARFATTHKILPLLDDIDRAISTYGELSPLKKSLEKTLDDLGLKEIPSSPETEFNPDLMDAVLFEKSDGETEVVAEVLRAGYYYEGSVLRPAMVKVKRV